MNKDKEKIADKLLTRVIKNFETPRKPIDDQIELIVGVLMILLDHPKAKGRCFLSLSHELTTQIEGKLLDKICAVLNKTYLIKGEEATLHDDTALEAIRDYLLEYDEFILYKHEKRILRKPKPLKRNIRKKRGKYD